jgi:endonuclease/exonuclease/phosphatase family metal-dependent hydrolase
MLARIETFLRRFRKFFSRSEWLIRLLRLSTSTEHANNPGLVLVQIDGLAHHHLERALREGNLPFLNRLILRENFIRYKHYAGMPSSTPAVQGELFYNIKGCVPAFKFRDCSTNKIFTMFEPLGASEVEKKLEKEGEPLLKEGSAYCDIFTGGAAEPHYCASTLGVTSFLKALNPIRLTIVLLLNIQIFFRTAILVVLEFFIALSDLFRGGFTNFRHFYESLQFILIRAAICILLRELIVVNARMDIVRGLPIIHVNFVGYDEQAHRRGPSSKYAHWTLQGIDDSIRRLWSEVSHSSRRQYDMWLYSDHGQLDVNPYARENGRSVQSAIREVLKESLAISDDASQKNSIEKEYESRGIQLQRANLLGCHFQKLIPWIGKEDEAEDLVITAMGPVGHIYLKKELNDEEKDVIAARLVKEARIPLVLAFLGFKQLYAWTDDGKFSLPQQFDQVIAKDHPFFEEVSEDFLKMCQRVDCGTFIISGWRKKGKTITFPLEEGSHGGPGAEECCGFALLPPDAMVNHQKEYLRPGNLHEAAQHFLGRRNIQALEKPYRYAQSKTLRVMTYNVHSCIGMDGRISPYRIARVIARHDPDIVALQELDVNRMRTGGLHQVEKLAEILKMTFHFHPSILIEEEQYGDAVLSRYPMKLMKAASLPRLGDRIEMEPRGALWVEIDIEGQKIQFLNTHLSLWRKECVLQAQALAGEHWIQAAKKQGPVVLCGDFNALPNSNACKSLGKILFDAQLKLEAHRPHNTFFGRYPWGRIDHVFVSDEVKIVKIDVPRTELEKISSDHLPLIVDFKLPT